MAVVENVKFANFFRSHMTDSVTAVATVFDIVDTSGLPVITGDEYFYLVLHQLNTGNSEIVKVTDVVSNCLTVERAAEGTTALAFEHGDRVELWFTAGGINDALDEVRVEIDKIVIPNAEAATDQGDVSVVNSVAYLINAAAGSPLHVKMPSGGANVGEYNAATPITVPRTVLLDIENGAYLTGDWTLDGCQLWAPVNKIFDGPTGAITFSANVAEVYPQWWMDDFGDDEDSFYDWTPALTAAHEAPDTAVRFVDRHLLQAYRLATNFAPVGLSEYRFNLQARLFLDNINFVVSAIFDAPVSGDAWIIDCVGCTFTTGITSQTWYADWVRGPTSSAPMGDEFDDLVNGIMGGEGVVRFTHGGYNIDKTVVVPAGITLQIDSSARVQLGSGNALVANCEIVARAEEVFFSTGFGATITGSLNNVLPSPEWFGDSLITNTTDYSDDPVVGGITGYLGKIFPVIKKTGLVDLFFKATDHEAAVGWESVLGEGIIDFTDADTTPSVKHYKNFRTNNTGDTTITNFDDGYVGKRIHVIAGDTNTFIDFSSPNLLGLVSSSQRLLTGDSLTALLDDAGVWHCFIERRTGGATVDWDSGWTLVDSATAVQPLNAAGGGPGVEDFQFSDTSKNDPVTGVTPASGLITDFIFSSPSAAGYSSAVIMLAQREDVGAGFQDNWLDLSLFNFSSNDELGSGNNFVHGIGIVAKSGVLALSISTNSASGQSIMRMGPNQLTDLGWAGTNKGMDFDDALIRIQMTSG